MDHLSVHQARGVEACIIQPSANINKIFCLAIPTLSRASRPEFCSTAEFFGRVERSGQGCVWPLITTGSGQGERLFGSSAPRHIDKTAEQHRGLIPPLPLV